MASFERILNNCGALESIFRYLDFKEHLKLIKICPQFENAIVRGVWRFSYKNLCIYRNCPGTYLLRYNTVNNVRLKCSLTVNEFNIILQHSLIYIHKLKLDRINSNYSIKSIISLKYHRLTELTLRDIVVDNTHLQQVAENCINLQSLTLIRFKRYGSESNIRPNVFGEMKALNKLEIYDNSFDAWNYYDVQQLFCFAHLKTLSIYISIQYSYANKRIRSNITDRVYNIENLRIGELYDLPADLLRFKNLKKLSLLSRLNRVSIDVNVLTQINNTYPDLCKLSLCGSYFMFEEFPHMNSLQNLTFKECKNISLQHFDEIFRKFKLKSLTLIDVQVTHEAENITDYNYISNTLETLTIKNVRSIMKIFFNHQHKFENVSKISILDYSALPTGLCFSHNFPYLRELKTGSYYISSEDILNIKHLKVLEFDLFDDMSWPYLEILFKHPTLTHITITPFYWKDVKSYNEHLPKSCEGFTTTLEYLSLPSIVYESGLNFWPSFRQRNKLLKLEIVDSKTFKKSAALM